MFTDFLIRTFIKNYEDTKNTKVRQAYGYLGSFVGIAANILLFIVKLIAGFLINSIAVIADAFNNLTDIGSSAVTLIGFRITNKPADKEHPFGHGRIEYISAMIIAFMVILVGFEFIQSSIKRIINSEPLVFDILSFGIMLFSILIKIWLSRFNGAIGKAIGSKAMEASSLDSMSDVIATSVVAFSILAARWTNFPIDGYIGAVVSLFILYNGFKLAKETMNPLLGEAPELELIDSIVNKTISYEGVVGVHDLIVHNYGPGRCVASIHAEIPASMDIIDAHELIDRAEKEISEELGIHLVIHMDPINTDDEFVRKTQEEVIEALKDIAECVSIHDFRVVGNEKHKNIIFDMVVPYEVAHEDEKALIKRAQEAIKSRHPNYEAVINIDRQYTILK